MIHFRVHDPQGLRLADKPADKSADTLADKLSERAAESAVEAAVVGGRWDLRSAYLFGPDGRPTRGVIEVSGGEIVCRAASDVPVGIALFVDTEQAGRIMLQTCFLPPRDEPYELFLEIARWLINQFVEECETWQMWNPALSGDAFARWDAARDAFRQALRETDPLAAERLARRSIRLGIDAGESMTVRHASHLLSRRYMRKAPSATTLGVGVDPRVPPNSASMAAAKLFDIISLCTPWKLIEPAPGRYDFSAIDVWAKWAAAERKVLVLGPLVDFGTTDGVPTELPPHFLAARGDPQRFRTLVWTQVRAVVSRYQNITPIFVAASGSNCTGWHDEGIDRMIELTRTAVVAVREVKRDARVVVEIQSPGAENWRGVRGGAWPTAFLQKLVTENLALTAAGVRITQGGAADPVRDLMTIGGLLDGYIGRELSIFLTGFGVPSASAAPQDEARGVWRSNAGWTPERQADWAESIFKIALARTFVEGVWWSRLQDAPDGARDGLIDARGKPKPALERLIALRRELSSGAAKFAKGGGKAG
ncbi:MAG: hypothetical protein ACKO3W_04005 [bacterium]